MKIINQQRELTTARLTGVWYLLLAVTGILGFMIFHPQIYVSDEPDKTLENLIKHESLARVRLLFELAIVISQALAAVWFYKLFRNIDDWGAWTLGILGMMNSAVIMISAISMASAIQVAGSSVLSFENKIILIDLLEKLSTNAWGVGGLFFGLWLIPMGYIVVNSKRMPVWLGRILIIGGFGYLLNTFIKSLGYTDPLVDILVIPATAGEFWMISYLLIYGIRASNEQSATFQKG